MNIAELLENYDINVAEDYVEPGYSKDNEGMIFLANWNNIPDEISDELEEKYNIEWEDEWDTCHNCGRIYRTSPDSYMWKPYYFYFENACELICGDCIKEDPEDYLETIVDDPYACEIFDIDLEEHGFEKINDDYFESGHYGTNDDPRKIMENLLEENPDYEYIFGNMKNEQFRVTFDVYRREKSS